MSPHDHVIVMSCICSINVAGVVHPRDQPCYRRHTRGSVVAVPSGETELLVRFMFRSVKSCLAIGGSDHMR